MFFVNECLQRRSDQRHGRRETQRRDQMVAQCQQCTLELEYCTDESWSICDNIVLDAIVDFALLDETEEPARPLLHLVCTSKVLELGTWFDIKGPLHSACFYLVQRPGI